MIYSMTGYGRDEISAEGKQIKIEIKTLNSKYLDLNIKIPSAFKSKELEIRNICKNKLVRGKVEVNLIVNSTKGESATINIAALKKYSVLLKQIATEEELPYSDILPALVRIPEVMQSSQEEDENIDTIWSAVLTCLDNAIQQTNSYRIKEGAVTATVFEESIANISKALSDVPSFERQRIDRVKERIAEKLESLAIKNYNKDRFEQELIFYLEKLDIAEEKVRLAANCDIFIELVNDTNRVDKGKKLGFISQEIGREINTLGSKANDTDIQQLVVQMKDELEKIKEQTLNIL